MVSVAYKSAAWAFEFTKADTSLSTRIFQFIFFSLVSELFIATLSETHSFRLATSYKVFSVTHQHSNFLSQPHVPQLLDMHIRFWVKMHQLKFCSCIASRPLSMCGFLSEMCFRLLLSLYILANINIFMTF